MLQKKNQIEKFDPKVYRNQKRGKKLHSLENTLMLGKTDANGKKGRQKMRWLNSITDSMDMNLSKLWDIAEDRRAWLPWWLSGWRIHLQCRRHRRHAFDPWVRKIPWRRKWKSTPIFLLGKSHGQRSLAGYTPWGHRESDMTYEKITTMHRNISFRIKNTSHDFLHH